MQHNFLIILLIGFLLSSCNDDETILTTDYTAQINNIANDVILATYEDLAVKGNFLKVATDALQLNPTEANLITAKNAWIAARSPWEQSEGFLFGPVDQEGIDPSIDSWPVNVVDLNNVLNSSNALTVSFLKQQEGTLKGFHTIEFLLWGENGVKKINDFNPRQFEYLAACSGVLAEDVATLYDLWKPTGGNFIRNVLEAGKNSTLYISQKSALEEISNALIVIADEVGNGKINDPFSASDLSLEESRFSANSKADFADNMRSIKNIYLGTYESQGDGKGLSVIIKNKDAVLDTEVKTAIDLAINKITSINGTFSDAVFNNRASIDAAQKAVRDLQELFESKVNPIISDL